MFLIENLVFLTLRNLQIICFLVSVSLVLSLVHVCVTERSSVVVEVKIYLYTWAVVTCMGVVVTVSWDLKMDWGLLHGNGLLKEELLYSHQVK